MMIRERRGEVWAKPRIIPSNLSRKVYRRKVPWKIVYCPLMHHFVMSIGLTAFSNNSEVGLMENGKKAVFYSLTHVSIPR